VPSEPESSTAPSRGASRPGLFERLRNRDHTQGSLYKSLFVLALPMVSTSVFAGVTFQLVNLKLVTGLGTTAAAAVMVTNQSLRQAFIMLIMGASFGTQGLVARAVGTGEQENADHASGQVMLMSAMMSAAMAILGLFFAAEMLGMMNVSPDVLEAGIPYVRLVFLLNFGFVFVFVANGVLGGAGDTTTPFVVSMVQTVVSLFGQWVLIYGNLGAPALGVRGVVLGLFCGQLISLLMIGRVIFGGGSRIHLRARHLRPDRTAMWEILRLSWPPALQMVGTFVVTIFFLRLMGNFGEKAQAAYSFGLPLAMVGPMIAFPLAGACATLVGQNLGAGNVRRAWRSLWVGLSVHASLLGCLGIALFFFRRPLLGLFTEDPEVLAIGDEMLFYQSLSFVMFAFYFVFFRALQGAGDVVVPMLISLGNSLLVVMPLGYYLAIVDGRGPSGIFIASFVGSLVSTTLTGAWIATGRWTRRAAMRTAR
jgi:putative MATE family efflux protein